MYSRNRSGCFLLLAVLLVSGCATTPVRLENGGLWKLHTIDDELLYGDSEITLRFDSPGNLGGFAGCNDYSGEYRYENGAIDVLEVEPTTARECDPAILEQEQRYLRILEDATNYHEQCDLLRMKSQEGERMLFKRVKR